MRDEEFWRLIRRARLGDTLDESPPDGTTESERLVRQLHAMLERLPDSTLVSFHRTLRRIHRRAERWALWTAFGIALSGADYDGFRAGICWLILRGRETYERVVGEPDELAGLPCTPGELDDAEELGSLVLDLLDPSGRVPRENEVAARERLYEKLGFVGEHARPRGDWVPENLAVFLARFPRLTRQYLPEGGEPWTTMVRSEWCPGMADQAGAPS
ncbi:DUF4240 domain-containing protein [Amycolatopsis sp. H20-H5]|uniref:DUF4240 domain-containing protein n=1 Tax=Amycolatopsis sp. H20-H5 TaxID=3046309 RepID=UPI002DB8AFDA|nr:DUF4240 domain-containing protein [Amycolatopsis sp. H20-H5]MEC3974052.1 DUF4240 domain-containing protein [Amycolatopsis sp. H20-H5]